MATWAVLRLYNQSLALVEELRVPIAPLPGPNPVLQLQACKWLNDSVNMGITERIGHLALWVADRFNAFDGVPLCYPLDLTGDGTNTDWAKAASAPTATDAVYTDLPRPPDTATPLYAHTSISGRNQEAIVESATAAGIPASGANSVLLGVRLNGVHDPQSTTKQNFNVTMLDGTNGVGFGTISPGHTNNSRIVFNITCPFVEMKPGTSVRYVRSDLDGANAAIRLAQTGSTESRVYSVWGEALTCDAILGRITVLACLLGGAEAIAGGTLIAGVDPKTGTPGADLTTGTGDADFPGGGTYIEANRNKASPDVDIMLDNNGAFGAGLGGKLDLAHGNPRAGISMAYKPSGLPNLIAKLMEVRLTNDASGGSNTISVKHDHDGKLQLFDGATSKGTMTNSLSTTDVNYIIMEVGQWWTGALS